MATRDHDDLYYGIEIDWCRCDLLESVPGKVSGAWVIKGTRMPAQTIIENHDACLDPPEIAEAYEVDARLVYAIVAFAEEYRAGARAKILASPEFAALLDGAPVPAPVDWGGCGLVEWMAGPMHDTWVLRGTPTPADMLMGHHDDGMPVQDIAEHYGQDEAVVAALIAFGMAYRAGLPDHLRAASNVVRPAGRFTTPSPP